MVRLVTTNTFSTPAASITELPRIVGTQRAGSTLTIDAGSMSTPSAYQWRLNGENVSGATGSAYNPPEMPHGAQVSCLVTATEGTAETPALKIYHDHATASHNTMDDAVLAIIPHQPATHIAKQDGDWSSASTWDAGTVPGAGAIVLVPFGRSVTYDVASSPRLDRLRIDGLLNFAIDQSTDLLVETIVVTQSGELRIGTPGGRLPIAYTANIRYSDRHYPTNSAAATDLDFAGTDPTLISRGLLWHGKVSIWAADVTPWLRTADDSAPMAGATSLTLASTPTNWAVGDTIVIGGTYSVTIANIHTHECEERVITSISGATVNWTGGLLYDHDHQNAEITTPTDLQPAIANKKRNVVMKTEAPHEDAVWRRAHTMAMHGTAIADIWGVAFLDMGRTDKSRPAGIIRSGAFAVYDRSVSTSAVVTQTLTAQSNVQSRYPAHLHFVGFGRGAEKSIMQDCYVQDAPAWAYVHHGCEADFFDNVGYAFVGAGMVSETADEIGAWVGNLMMGTRRGFNGDKASSGNPKNGEGTIARFGDFGFTGMGMFFRGRAMRVNNNFVMACPSAYVFFHRANPSGANQLSDKISPSRENLDVKSLSYLNWNEGKINSEDVPIRHFAGNECAGIPGYGFAVTKSGAKQDHALAINVKNNKFWAIGIGVHLEYVARYNFLDNRFYATARGVGSSKRKTGYRLTGIQISNVRNHIEGFEDAFDLWGVSNFAWTKDFSLTEDPLFAIIAPSYVNNDTNVASTQEGVAFEAGLQTVRAVDVTLQLETAPTAIEPYFTGPNFPAYSWDGTTSITCLDLPGSTYGIRAYDIQAETVNPGEFYLVPSFYTVTPFAIEDSLGTSPLPVSYDTSGLYSGQSDHNTRKPSSGPFAGVTLEQDSQTTNTSGYDLQELALRDGYWTYDPGDGEINMLVFPMYISDRLTGRPGIVTIAVEVTGNVSSYTNNGAYTLSATAPARADITTTTAQNTSITVDILTAATVEAGATKALYGDKVKPDYGEVVDNGDGTITYTPDRNYVSPAGVPDTMFFFVTDGRGRYKTVQISITVTA